MASNTVTFTPSPLVKYLGLTVLLAAAVGASYFAKIFPSWVGWASIGAYIPSVIYFAAHDLEGTKPPNGLPSWITFAIVTVAAAVEGALGQFVLSNGTLVLTAFLAWLIVVLGAIFHALAEDQGANIPANAEAWATALLGIAIGLIGYFAANPTAGISAWITTIVMVVGQYIHINTDGSSISATPVTPAPAPAPT